MSEKNIKITGSFYISAEYEHEEQYLSEMHKKGWKFKKDNGVWLTFEKCEPEDAVYKIDFRDEIKDKDSYIKMFEDYGWEYVSETYGFYFFRKKAVGISPEDLEIFSDNESKLEMLKRIIFRYQLPLFASFMLSMTTTLYIIKNPDPVAVAIIILFCILFVLYIYILIRSFISYSKLKKKCSKK